MAPVEEAAFGRGSEGGNERDETGRRDERPQPGRRSEGGEDGWQEEGGAWREREEPDSDKEDWEEGMGKGAAAERRIAVFLLLIHQAHLGNQRYFPDDKLLSRSSWSGRRRLHRSDTFSIGWASAIP